MRIESLELVTRDAQAKEVVVRLDDGSKQRTFHVCVRWEQSLGGYIAAADDLSAFLIEEKRVNPKYILKAVFDVANGGTIHVPCEVDDDGLIAAR